MLKADELTFAIEKQIERYERTLKMESVGTVLRVGDNIATIYGLDDAMVGEIIEFENKSQGLVLNLETDSVGVIIFGDDSAIKEGETVKRTGKVVQIPVGEGLVGRVINPLGQPLDGKGPIPFKKTRPLEATPPNVVRRQPVDEPLQTGIVAIDAMIPIGRGQRELIIGDRQTGKTAIVVDTILNQKKSDVFCIYVAVGQKMSNVVSLVKTLEENGAMDYTTVVVATSEDAASLQYIAPFAGCSIGEEYLHGGKHAVVFYDDLSKHAQAYRELSLLLNRPPGREAYPGDVFYLHSRLLERAAKVRSDLGGGSLTALPIIETQAGDVSGYIPTNVISITDGQIYLETELFNSGVRPAINVGLSVSRVGGKAQTKAMKQVAGQLRLSLAQYRELAAFAQISSDLDKSTMAQLKRGERMVEILKQDICQPMALAKQVITLYAGNEGHLDEYALDQVKPFLQAFLALIEKQHSDIIKTIETEKKLTDETLGKLSEIITAFKSDYRQGVSA